jgi:hypothetical protein
MRATGQGERDIQGTRWDQRLSERVATLAGDARDRGHEHVNAKSDPRWRACGVQRGTWRRVGGPGVRGPARGKRAREACGARGGLVAGLATWAGPIAGACCCCATWSLRRPHVIGGPVPSALVPVGVPGGAPKALEECCELGRFSGTASGISHGGSGLGSAPPHHIFLSFHFFLDKYEATLNRNN